MTTTETLAAITAMYNRSFGYDHEIRSLVANTTAALENGNWMTARDGAMSIKQRVGGDLGNAACATIFADTATQAQEFTTAWKASLAANADRYGG